MDKIQNLVKAYEEYIEILGAEIDDLAPMASTHGWKSARFEAGKQAREKIAAAKKELGL